MNRRQWFIFFGLAMLSLAIWLGTTYRHFSFIDLSTDKATALKTARDYLVRTRGLDPAAYQTAIIFSGADAADQFLQKAIGFKAELKFLQEHQLELFFWKIRFLRENEEEEFVITISAASGQITGFSHKIKETDARPPQTEATAQEQLTEFLKQKFNFNPELYLLHSHHTRKLENRTEHSFTWEKKDVKVSWSDDPQDGGGIIVTGGLVSGGEILAYNKDNLHVPDEYYRQMEQKMNIGKNIAVLFRLLFYTLLCSSVYFVIIQRNNLVMHNAKRFCIGLTGVVFLFNAGQYFNEFSYVLFHYPTTSSFASYFWQSISESMLETFIMTITLLMPCLAGESLHYAIFPQQTSSRFNTYLMSTFRSREVAQKIFLGYLCCCLMIGIQSAAFWFGQKYLGVWVQYTWLTQISGSYFPFLTAMTVGLSASFAEEIAYRLYGITLMQKITKNIFAAVFISSLIWGYGHATYLIFPMWFRVVEVTILGLFLSYIYLRHGIISVLVAHYLFDVFWGCAAFLLGRSTPQLFYSTLLILALPMIAGVICYLQNLKVPQRPLRWRLNRHQVFNLEVLENYLSHQPAGHLQDTAQIKQKVIAHGWDPAVVDIAFENSRRKVHPGP